MVLFWAGSLYSSRPKDIAMAIEIIKSGELKEEKQYTATCRSCGCVFRFQRRDAMFKLDQRDGDYLSLPCPECFETVNVQA